MSDVTASKPEGSSRTPCAACKIQTKKCTDKCVLAPYFPQDDLQKFPLVHKLFGNGHVIKLLQDDPQKFRLVHRLFGNGHVTKLLQNLPAEKRGDAVSSMVYEASEKNRDPVLGCVGVINDLRNKVAELELQLASKQAEVANISQQHANLLTMITGSQEPSDPNFYCVSPPDCVDTDISQPVLEYVDNLSSWELFWP